MRSPWVDAIRRGPFIRRLEEACALAAGNVPCRGGGPGDRELLIAVTGLAAVAGEGFDHESA